MEEQVLPPPPPPPPQDYANKINSPKPKLPNISAGTYVVQVPKDQIYRVPPPENARIAELHRNSPQKETNRTRCWCLVFIIVLISIIIFIGGLLGGLFSMVLSPKDPRFAIQRFFLQESKHNQQYKLTLQVKNSNSNLGVLYKEGGDVSLSLRRQKVASGTYPTFFQSHQNSTEFGVTLKGSMDKFPKEMEESITNNKNKVHVTFSLTIHVKAQMKMGLLRSGTMEYDVTCQMTVDTLAQTTRVLSQQCQTKRH